MKETYTNYFLHILNNSNITLNQDRQNDLVYELLTTGRINKLINYVSEILKLADNRTFIKFDEKYIQLLIFAILMNYKEVKTYTEYPTKAGYIDIILFKNSDLSKYNIMIELKYLKKSEYRKNKKLLLMKKEEAIAQLNNYSSDDRYLKIYINM